MKLRFADSIRQTYAYNHSIPHLCTSISWLLRDEWWCSGVGEHLLITTDDQCPRRSDKLNVVSAIPYLILHSIQWMMVAGKQILTTTHRGMMGRIRYAECGRWKSLIRLFLLSLGIKPLTMCRTGNWLSTAAHGGSASHIISSRYISKMSFRRSQLDIGTVEAYRQDSWIISIVC